MKRFLITFHTLLSLLHIAAAETLYVASATSLKPTVDTIINSFTTKYPFLKIKVSYGSSGQLYYQIRNGAPFDVFLSADRSYVENLIRAGEGIHESITVFAKGKLALFSKDKFKNIYESIKNAKKVAVANPKFAPYGRTAIELLHNLGLYESLKNRLVFGANVSQAAHFVTSGGAEVGIVALSLARHYEKGFYREIPPRFYTPIKHVAVITTKGKDKKGSWMFIKFLKTERSRKILSYFGFES